MKITMDSWGRLEFDLVTETRGNSATKCFSSSTTEVYYGGLHASVRFKDKNFSVTLNSDPGEWQNETWARQKALTVIQENLSMDDVLKIMKLSRDAGVKEGRANLQAEIHSLLNINT